MQRFEAIGNLGKDAEIKTFQSGDKIANISIGVTERWKDKQSGERKEHTEWFNCVINGGLVGVVEQYTRKGSKVFVAGKLRTRKWQDRDGNDRYTTEVVVRELELLDKRESGGGQQDSGWGNSRPQGQQGGGNAGGWADDLDDDVPFATPYPVRKRGVI